MDPAVYRAQTWSAALIPFAAGEVNFAKSWAEIAPRPGYRRSVWAWDADAVANRKRIRTTGERTRSAPVGIAASFIALPHKYKFRPLRPYGATPQAERTIENFRAGSL
jgi:hypothetical protein